MPTPVTVTACDNELYILASQWNGSSELLHIKSGKNDPVNTSFNLESVLPKGTWQITVLGINWGGPWKFAVTVGTPTPFVANGSGTGTVGYVFSKTSPAITI